VVAANPQAQRRGPDGTAGASHSIASDGLGWPAAGEPDGALAIGLLELPPLGNGPGAADALGTYLKRQPPGDPLLSVLRAVMKRRCRTASP